VNVKGERRDVPVGTGTAIISTAAAAAAAASGVTRWTVRGGGQLAVARAQQARRPVQNSLTENIFYEVLPTTKWFLCLRVYV